MLLQPDRYRHTPTAAPERASTPKKRDTVETPTSADTAEDKKPREEHRGSTEG